MRIFDRKYTAQNITEKTVNVWKRQYPEGVFKITVSDEFCYVRTPTDKEVYKLITQSKILNDTDLGMFLLKMIWLGGHDGFMADEKKLGLVLDQIATIGDNKVEKMKSKNIL